MTVKQGKTNFIEVHVHNPSNDVVIKRRTVLRRLQLVRSVTRIPVTSKEKSPAKAFQEASECAVSAHDETQATRIRDRFKNIDLMGLTPKRR